MAEPRVVTVEVNGQKYPIRTVLDPNYVMELATFVEQRMQLAAASSPSSDSVGLAILAALNITDQFFRARTERMSDTDALAARAEALERIVDQALALAD